MGVAQQAAARLTTVAMVLDPIGCHRCLNRLRRTLKQAPTALAPAAGYKYFRCSSDSTFFSLSQCKGITRSSEDSSELVFLLVENYNYIDALSGLRIG